MPHKNFFIIVFFICLILSPLAVASAAGSQLQEMVYVGEDEVIEGNLYKAGASVEVAGTVNGDIFAVGATVLVSGKVTGDVFAVGSSVKITGRVEGNVRAAGSTLAISGTVGKNVLAGASTLTLEEKGAVGGSLTAGAGAMDLRGKIGKDVLVGTGSLILAGEIGGQVSAYLGNAKRSGQLAVYPSAIIEGDLTYVAQEAGEIKDGATIKGALTHNLPPVKPLVNQEKVKKIITAAWWLSRVFSLFALLVVGLILVSFLPKVVSAVGDKMFQKTWANIGKGLVYFIVVPVIALALIFTIIGLPLAFIGITLYFISLYIAKVLAGIALGYSLLKALGKKEPQMIWSLILGVIILIILTSLPFIGWLISLVLMWWALGALVAFEKEELAKWK